MSKEGFTKMNNIEEKPPGLNSHLDNGGGVKVGTANDIASPVGQDCSLINNRNPDSSVASPTMEEKVVYSCWHFRPPLLHRCANIHFFLTCHCLLLLLYGLIYSYIASIQTTLEKQFDINAKRASVLASANMVGYLPALIVVSYYGGRGHRPRFIAFGMLLVALGSFCASMPYFLKRHNGVELANGNMSLTSVDVCTVNRVAVSDIDPMCQTDEAYMSHKSEYALVFTGMVLVGIGGASVLTLGFPYIDDNVSAETSPLYIGIAFSARVFGPVLGYLMGTLCTGIYVTLSDPGFLPSDPNWLGAWWLGFVIIALSIIPPAILMLGFPKHLTSSKTMLTEVSASSTTRCLDDEDEDHRLAVESPSIQNPMPNSTHPESLLESVKGLWATVWKLARNNIFRSIIIGTCADIFIITGFFVYLPKYLELQFHETTPRANTYSGIVAVLAMALATLAGGWVVKRFRLEPRGVMLLVLSCSIVWTLGNLILMAVGCPGQSWAGTWENNILNVSTPCTEKCGCSSSRFNPICGDNKIYFSACYAGCHNLTDRNYTNCDCVDSGWAVKEACKSDCDNEVPYLIILFFIVFYVSLRNTGHMMITIRCVAKRDKDMALGVAQVCTGLFGVIPGPVLYATAIDTACTLFSETCGEQGYCLLYDTNRFRYLYHGISACFNVIPVVAYTYVFMKCRGKTFEPDTLSPSDSDVRNETVMSQYESAL